MGMNYRYFLPFHRLSFHFIDCFCNTTTKVPKKEVYNPIYNSLKIKLLENKLKVTYYIENYKTWVKEMKEDINGKTLHVYGLKELILCRCLYYPKLSTYLYNSYQILNGVFFFFNGVFYRKKKFLDLCRPTKDS